MRDYAVMQPKLQMLTLSMNEIIDQKNTLNNFTLKKLFFVATNIVKTVIKVSMYIVDLEQHLMKVHWVHGNNFDTNVITFVDNSALSHSGNHKNNFYYLLKGLPMILETVLLLQRKNLVLTLAKQKQSLIEFV